MTQTHEAIEFRQARDAGDVLNITFQFLRQNVVKLGKSLLFFVAPTMALATALSTQFQSSMFDPDSLIGINLGLLRRIAACVKCCACSMRKRRSREPFVCRAA